MTHWTLRGLASSLEGFRLGPVDLEVGGGRAVAVVGRSGSGKTTLLRTVAGFLPCDAGTIVRDGHELTHLPPEERSIGYVPQGFGLFPHRTVEENVRYPLRLRGRADQRERTRGLLRRFGLNALADRRASEISSGESQKVALARAIASEPQLLLWDEPAHALDVEARGELVDGFREMEREEGIPLLLVTHDPTLAFTLADRFVLLGAGRVLLAGDARELVDRPPDSFTARFAGFDNVLGRAELSGARSALASWLLERCGPEGVAFASPFLGPVGGTGRWEAEVRAVRPSADGLSVELNVGGLAVRARTPWRTSTIGASLGATVRFDLAPHELRPLGGAPDRPNREEP